MNQEQRSYGPNIAFREQNRDNLELIEAPVKYCLYARKSTESDELQALSIDSQIKGMLEMAKSENMDIAEVRKESHSAKLTILPPLQLKSPLESM